MKNVKKIELHYMSEKLNASRNMLLDMWTSPVDQPVSYGMFGQTMDNAEALPTACPNSQASRPHTQRHNKFYFLFIQKNYFDIEGS